MTQEKIKLPPRKWYSLEQAAEKLTRDTGEHVAVDDLLHYYLIDLLELSIYIDTTSKVFRIADMVFTDLSLNDDKKILPISYLDFHLFGNLNKNITIPYVFSITQGVDTIYQKENLRITISGCDEKFESVLYISGFMNMWDSIGDKPKSLEKIKELKEKGICLNGFSFLISPYNNEDLRAVIQIGVNDKCKEDIFITLDNIYILDSDLNAFLHGKKREKNIGEIINKNISPRKEANQTEFIKSLIKAHYGTDEPERVRTLLGKNGDLSRKFAREGISINITPETVRNWLNTEK